MTPEQAAKITRPSESDRWRVEEVGYFDGSGDVYEFIDRLNSIGSIKAPRFILKNIVTCFIKDGGSKEAYNWWIGEISNKTRDALQNQGNLGPLCSALKKRFGIPENQLLEQLNRMTYTRKDVATQSATGFVGQVMMLCHRINGDTTQFILSGGESRDSVNHDSEPGLQGSRHCRVVRAGWDGHGGGGNANAQDGWD